MLNSIFKIPKCVETALIIFISDAYLVTRTISANWFTLQSHSFLQHYYPSWRENAQSRWRRGTLFVKLFRRSFNEASFHFLTNHEDSIKPIRPLHTSVFTSFSFAKCSCKWNCFLITKIVLQCSIRRLWIFKSINLRKCKKNMEN